MQLHVWVREKRQHTVAGFPQGAHFKGNFFQKQAKETIVWWKIPLIYSSWDKSQSKQHLSKIAHVCYSTEERRKQPWNFILKKSLHLKNHAKSKMDVWISQWNHIGWTDVKMLSWAFVCFSTFLSISSGMVTRLTPRLGPGFLDSHSPIKALDLGLTVGLTSWRPEPGRSGPERAGFGWNGSGWWVGGFYMLSHK